MEIELRATESGKIPVAYNDNKVDHSFSDVAETSIMELLLPRAWDQNYPQKSPAMRPILGSHTKFQSSQDQSFREDWNSSDFDPSQSPNEFPVLGFSRHLGFPTEDEHTSNRLRVEGSFSSPSAVALQRNDDDEDKNCRKKKCRSSKSTVPPSTDMKPLACPFNKYDDRLFGSESPDPSYRICGSCSFVTVAHLK